jgi:hypothetical protein
VVLESPTSGWNRPLSFNHHHGPQSLPATALPHPLAVVRAGRAPGLQSTMPLVRGPRALRVVERRGCGPLDSAGRALCVRSATSCDRRQDDSLSDPPYSAKTRSEARMSSSRSPAMTRMPSHRLPASSLAGIMSAVVLVLLPLACSKSPPPRHPGDPCHEGACPDGMRCETPVETYQRAGKRRGAPIKGRSECLLMDGRCITTSDCPNKSMECRHSAASSNEVGFCVGPPMSTPTK